MAIIGISGKIGSGKDTVGKIIQYLTSVYLKGYYEGERKYTYEQYLNQSNPTNITFFEIKKFADILKDIVCLLIGCTREQLEDQKFKNTELDKEWWKIKTHRIVHGESVIHYISYIGNEGWLEAFKNSIYYEDSVLIKLTPRLLLQLLGTECGRDIIHPNIWVNSLFSKYKPFIENYPNLIKSNGQELIEGNMYDMGKAILPNWIITDMRFPNELETVKDRRGISIRVNRHPIIIEHNGKKHHINQEDFDKEIRRLPEHESEKALDNANFDYIIDNNGTIEELIEKVKEILIKEKFI